MKSKTKSGGDDNNLNDIKPTREEKRKKGSSKISWKKIDFSSSNNENEDCHSNTSTTSTNLCRARPSACVFVASLNSNRTDDELSLAVTDQFSQWGKISTVKVLRDMSNRPYAFVQYTNDDDCKLAIEKGHNSILNERAIRCEAAKVNRTLFIQSKTFLSKSNIAAKLQQFGEIELLTPSNKSGSIRSDDKLSQFWFCKFSFREDAIKAFASLTERNEYQVDWAQNIDSRRNEDINLNDLKFDKFSVFISQLHPNLTKSQLQERFERHGKIENIHLVKKERFSFAFIKYETESGAAAAVERENHSLFDGKLIHIQYREFQSSPKLSINPYGVPLAPPPINLSRKTKYLNPSQKHAFNGNSNMFNRGGKILQQQKHYQNRNNSGSGNEFTKWDFDSNDRNYYSRERKHEFRNRGKSRHNGDNTRYTENDNYEMKNSSDKSKYYYITPNHGDSKYGQEYFISGEK